MIDLGQDAVTVLSAYGVTLVFLGGLVLSVWRRARRVRQELAGYETGAPEKAGTK